MTFIIKTLTITTFSATDLIVTFSMTILSISTESSCWVVSHFHIVMLNVIKIRAIVMGVIMLNAVMLKVMAP